MFYKSCDVDTPAEDHGGSVREYDTTEYNCAPHEFCQDHHDINVENGYCSEHPSWGYPYKK